MIYSHAENYINPKYSKYTICAIFRIGADSWLNLCSYQQDVSTLTVPKLDVCGSEHLKRPPSPMLTLTFSSTQLSDDLGHSKTILTQMQFSEVV